MSALLLLCGCRFGPLDLLGDAEGARVPLLLERQQHSLCWTGSSKQVLQQRATDAAFQEAADAGLKAAHKVCMCVCVFWCGCSCISWACFWPPIVAVHLSPAWT